MSVVLKIINNIITLGLEKYGRYYSSYRGFVFDNQDPDGYGRIRLKVPQVYGTQVMDYWAWQKGTFSGKDYGFQCIPQIGDMVFVEFEYGDPKKPIWTYGHFSKDINGNNEKPEELKDTKKYWFRTPNGTIIILDDNTKTISFKNSEITEDEQPALLGDTSVDILKELIEAIKKLTVSTGTGPSGTPINITEFQAILEKLETMKSKLIKLQ